MSANAFPWIAYEDRAVVLVDAANMHEACRKNNVFIAWDKFKGALHNEMKLLGIHYFTGVHNKARIDRMHKFHDFLQFSGILLHTKEFVEHKNAGEVSSFKANMDTEITLMAVQLATAVDHIILMTGDGDFTPLVKYLQGQGKIVTVISDWTYSGANRNRKPQHICAESLRKCCNYFVNVLELEKMQALRINRQVENSSAPLSDNDAPSDEETLSEELGHAEV